MSISHYKAIGGIIDTPLYLLCVSNRWYQSKDQDHVVNLAC